MRKTPTPKRVVTKANLQGTTLVKPVEYCSQCSETIVTWIEQTVLEISLRLRAINFGRPNPDTAAKASKPAAAETHKYNLQFKAEKQLAQPQ